MSDEKQTTILIVDDQPQMLTAIRRSIRNPKYRMLLTTSPREALELLVSEPVDLLLSDVDMPEMSGLELMAKARDIKPESVRILITGASTMDTAVRAINEGEVHRFVSKPFDAAELRQIVKDGVERKRELEIASEASRHARRRRILLEQLELEHPGITHFRRDADGVYQVDSVRAVAAAASLGMDPFLTTT